MSSSMNYQQFEHVLMLNNAPMGASDIHACLLGLFCGGMNRENQDWKLTMTQLLDDEAMALSVDLLSALEQMQQTICMQLESGFFNTQLLLPDDEVALGIRIQALASWCEGWLLGFGSGSSKSPELSDEGKEALADIRNISQVDPDVNEHEDAEVLEQMERDFLELCEHIKISVQLIFADVQAAKSSFSETNASQLDSSHPDAPQSITTQNSKSIH